MAEAARLLKVSQSSVWRWIRRGQLKAYRAGQRGVRLKLADVEAALSPVSEEIIPQRIYTSMEDIKRLEPISEERKRYALAIVEKLRRNRARQLEERGGIPFSPSWKLINEARDERTKQIEDTIHPRRDD